MAYNPGNDATLVSGVFDPNATLAFGGDDQATLVGVGGPTPFVATMQRAPAPPTIVPHIRMVPHYSYFPLIDMDVPRTLKFGRVTEPATDEPDFIGFPSKVVSRRHAEIWTVNNEFYVRDTKSQSGTFLNAMRLSLPGEESKPFKLKNGDAIQFGVDRRGTTSDDMKCVAMTIELSFRKLQPADAARSAIPNMAVSSAYIPPLSAAGDSPTGPGNMSDLTLVMNNQHQLPPQGGSFRR